jgi:hypothetical protein
MLFEDKQRTRTAPLKRGEREFDFYDSAAAPSYAIYRDLLNRWVAELPEDERSKVCTRFRKGDTLQYQAALAELIIHAALARQGFNVQIHPTCEQSN